MWVNVEVLLERSLTDPRIESYYSLHLPRPGGDQCCLCTPASADNISRQEGRGVHIWCPSTATASSFPGERILMLSAYCWLIGRPPFACRRTTIPSSVWPSIHTKSISWLAQLTVTSRCGAWPCTRPCTLSPESTRAAASSSTLDRASFSCKWTGLATCFHAVPMVRWRCASCRIGRR